jgi:hypothetical protein
MTLSPSLLSVRHEGSRGSAEAARWSTATLVTDIRHPIE